MKIISKIKENLWSTPLIGGVLIFISLFTPVAVDFIQWDNIIFVWMWGLFHQLFYGSGYTDFDSSLLSFIPSIISSIIIGISAIIMIYCAYNYRKDKKDPRNLLLISSVAVLISATLWIIFMEVGWLIGHDYSFWRHYAPNFGIIGIFLGAVIALYSHYIIKKNRK